MAWRAALWLWRQGSERLQKNLTAAQREELRALMTKSKGRPSNLSEKERSRFRTLVKQGITGSQ